MPSASASSRSASKRALGSFGMIFPPPASTSRYSRITGESKIVEPSSRTSTGTFPSGFCLLNESESSCVDAGSITILPSRPRMLTPSLTLRPNGEPIEVRTLGMDNISISPGTGAKPVAATSKYHYDGRSLWTRPRRSARDDEVHGLGAFAFLVGLHIEGYPLSFVKRLQAGTLDCGDVYEHVAPAIVRLDEAVAALGIEEFHRTCHCHRDYSYPRGCHAAGPHGATARPDIHKREGNRPVTASVTPPAPTGGGTSKPAASSVGQNRPVEKCRN